MTTKNSSLSAVAARGSTAKKRKTASAGTSRTSRRPKAIKVSLWATDFKLARTNDPTNCPIANALHRITKKQSIHVGRSSALVGGRFFRLPSEATQFIDGWDGGKIAERVKLAFTLIPITRQAYYHGVQ